VRTALRRSGQLLLLVAGMLLVGLLTGTITVATVASSSMEPTVCTGDRVLLWHAGVPDQVERGDVVTLTGPDGRGPLLKRVVALEGQRVEVYDGRLLVDGRRQVESYLDLESVDGTFFGPVTVGPGRVFVLGDRREFSVDSRSFGDVPREDLTGRVLLGPAAGCGP
jgi:signal peptidase I